MYKYEDLKPELFTDEGYNKFLKIRDRVRYLLNVAGAFKMGNAITGVGGGDSWFMLACVDRLVELNEIEEVTTGDVSGQNRVFIAKY